MKIVILAVGTRGDVQPYIALGLGLRAAGHDVRIAAASNFEQFVRGYGLEYARLEGNFRELMEADMMQQFMARRNPLLAYRDMTRMTRQVLECFAAAHIHRSEAGYRLGSDRGSPNHGSTLLSKRVMA